MCAVKIRAQDIYPSIPDPRNFFWLLDIKPVHYIKKESESIVKHDPNLGRFYDLFVKRKKWGFEQEVRFILFNSLANTLYPDAIIFDQPTTPYKYISLNTEKLIAAIYPLNDFSAKQLEKIDCDIKLKNKVLRLGNGSLDKELFPL